MLDAVFSTDPTIYGFTRHAPRSMKMLTHFTLLAQVNPVNNRPKEVIGATIGVMLFGPIVLTVFMLKDRMTGKQH